MNNTHVYTYIYTSMHACVRACVRVAMCSAPNNVWTSENFWLKTKISGATHKCLENMCGQQKRVTIGESRQPAKQGVNKYLITMAENDKLPTSLYYG